MARQFIECKFRPTDKRGYTYLNEGAPVRVGDEVKVPDKSGVGWNRVTVSAIDLPAPSYDCKPVLGLYDGADRDEKILAAGDNRGKVVSAKAPKPKPTTGDLFS